MPDNKKDIERIQNDLLRRSIAYIELYSIEQLDNTKLHIEKVNEWLARTGDPSDIQKLSAALKALNEMYSFLLEQSTTILQASVIPMANLIKASEEANINHSSIVVNENSSISNSKINRDDLKSMYTKYED